jgi:hypothetical protein
MEEWVLSKLWRKLLANRSNTLADILSDSKNKENLLGVILPNRPGREEIERDAVRMLSYSNSSDYAIFVKESWAIFLKSMDKVMDGKLEDREIDFHRGKMSSIIDLLRISYMARDIKDGIEKEKKQINN